MKATLHKTDVSVRIPGYSQEDHIHFLEQFVKSRPKISMDIRDEILEGERVVPGRNYSFDIFYGRKDTSAADYSAAKFIVDEEKIVLRAFDPNLPSSVKNREEMGDYFLEYIIAQGVDIMIQLYQRKREEDLTPVPESLVDILTREEIAVVYKPTDTPAGMHDEPLAINIIREGDRGFGDWDAGQFYEIDAEKKRVSKGNFPFRHLDKCATSDHYFVDEKVTINDFLAEFERAGYEIPQEG